MEKGKKESLLNNLIGTPEVQISLKTKTIVLFFGALVSAAIIIFLAYAIIKKG